jgi:hypothetical protein
MNERKEKQMWPYVTCGAEPWGTNLENADLEKANLGGARFRGALLRRAKFRGASLADATFYFADARRADFRDADLRGASFKHADLRGADLRGANIEDARFWGAKLDGAIMPDGRTWEEYRGDPLKGIFRSLWARWRAIQDWKRTGSPVFRGVPKENRLLVAAFVAIHGAGLLDRPGRRSK